MRFISSALAILTWSILAVAAPERPNIVLIIGDDVGWPYHGFLTSPQQIDTNVGRLPVQQVVRTPNLDALSSQGVTFSRGYTTTETHSGLARVVEIAASDEVVELELLVEPR